MSTEPHQGLFVDHAKPPFKRLVALIALLALAVYSTMAWHLVESDRRQQQITHAELKLQSQANASAIETALEITARSLQDIADDLSLWFRSQPSRRILRTTLLSTPYLQDLQVYDGNANLLEQAADHVAPADDLERIFERMRQGVVEGFGSLQGELMLYRAYSDEFGDLQGVIIAIFDSNYFAQDLHQRLPLSNLLIDHDDTVLSAFPESPAGSAVDYSALLSELPQETFAKRGYRIYEVGGYLVSSHQFKSHPVRLLQIFEAASLQLAWHKLLQVTVTIAALLSLIVAVFVLGWRRAMKQHDSMVSALQKLNLAVSQTPAPILITDLQGRIEYTNAAFCRISGYESDQVIGVNLRRLQSGLTAEPVLEQLWQRVRSGDTWTGLLANRRRDGGVYWVDAVIAPLRDQDHSFSQFFAVCTDVTARIKTEQSLAIERQRLRNIISGTQVGTWEWNITTGEVIFNERWAEIIGYTLAELSPISIDTWVRYTHPDDLRHSDELLKRHFRRELNAYECEVRMRHRNGEWIWVLDRGQVYEWDENGEPVWMAGTHAEIDTRKRYELILRESESNYRNVVENIQEVIFRADPSGAWTFLNRAWTEITGFAIESSIGRPGLDFIHGADEDCARRLFLAGDWQAETFRRDEIRLVCSDGSIRWLAVLARTECREGVDEICGVFGTLTDITERKLADDKLRLAANVFEHAREGIVVTDLAANIRAVNQAYCQMTGYSEAELIGANTRIFNGGRQNQAFYAELWRQLHEQGYWRGEVWNRRRSGEFYAAAMTISTVRDARGTALHYVGLCSDVTVSKEYEARLEHVAHFDDLTGLPNRVLLHDRLAQAIASTRRRNSQLAVAFIDLDGFKEVNDLHGHEVGDQLLQIVAKRMQSVVRQEDTIARLGGDEFVALLIDYAGLEASAPIIDRLLTETARPVHIDDRIVQVSGSIGITFWNAEHDTEPDHLLRQADQAMYQAKQAGKNRFHIFDALQDRTLRAHRENLERIGAALARQEFVLFYQPQVNMRTGAVIGAEALIRWQHPELGMLPPDRFLPIVENHALIREIGEWVIETALQQLEAWSAVGLDIPVSINIAPYQLQDPNFVRQLESILDRHPWIGPNRLELEVLETRALEDISNVSSIIERCMQIGVTFALDDFGTGYSSLTYLKNLPARRLKVDRSFVGDMTRDPDDLAILEGIIGLSSAFRREVIAEGVESVEHGQMLLQLGCEHAQGFCIARPMPGAELPIWAEHWQPDPLWKRQCRLDRDRLPILFAIVDHKAWIHAVADYCNGTQATPPEPEAAESRFGEWLYRQEPLRRNRGVMFEELELLHQQVHRIAAEAVGSRASQGQTDDALLESLFEISRALVDLLAGLIETETGAAGAAENPDGTYEAFAIH